jgi:hypothetical protein
VNAAPAPSGAPFWVGLGLGATMVVIGVVGLLDKGVGPALDVGSWVIGAGVAHDFVLAPIVVVVSLVLGRAVPLPWRAPVRSALFATGVVVIVVYPALRGFGRETATGNPSVQPLDYATALLTVLGVVWCLATCWLVAIALRVRRERRSSARACGTNASSR